MAASGPLRELWFDDVGGGPAGVVMLDAVRDAERLRSAVAGAEGVVLVDRVADVSALLRDHRVTASLGIVAVYVLIYLALALRYGARDALVILLPPAGAALLTLGLLGWIGSPLNLFNLLALLLVLGMGVDYAIFLREGRRTQPTVLLAIGLSAFTTWISFGLLSLSATPFVRSMGLTLAAGIALVFVLAVWLGPQGVEEDA
jgi:predicted exporter